jgi:hypothetical protein
MLEVFGASRVFAFVELEEDVHPVVDPVEHLSSVELFGRFLDLFGIGCFDEGVVMA